MYQKEGRRFLSKLRPLVQYPRKVILPGLQHRSWTRATAQRTPAMWMLACVFCLFCTHASSPNEAHAQSVGNERWYQVASVPRIGDEFTMVEVDPSDSLRIYVGTGEGVILRSEDGGITFEEMTVDPHRVVGRTVGLASPLEQAPDPTSLGVYRPFSGVRVPYSSSPQVRATGAFDRLSLSTGLFTYSLGYNNPSFSLSNSRGESRGALLGAAVRSRDREREPVRALSVCSGAAFDLFAVVGNVVYGGSNAESLFVPLLAMPSVNFTRVECAQTADGVLIAAASNSGVFVSRDRGISFEPVLDGELTGEVNAIAWKDDGTLYAASGSSVRYGKPLQRNAPFRSLFPAGSTIRSLARDAEGRFWFGTDDGLWSMTEGQEPVAAGTGIFDGQRAPRVVSYRDARGQSTVAVLLQTCLGRRGACRDSAVYSTNDGGLSWQPMFSGFTRRVLDWMTVAQGGASQRGAHPSPSRIWIVTGGELWTSARIREESTVPLARKEWAEYELNHSPTLEQSTAAVLRRNGLAEDEVDGRFGSLRGRNGFPIVEASFLAEQYDSNRRSTYAPVTPRVNETQGHFFHGVLYVQCIWELPEAVATSEEIERNRAPLYELRRQLTFAIEDAWHERRLHLMRIAEGDVDGEQLELVFERLEVLDAVLSTWTGFEYRSRPAMDSTN